MKKRLAMILTLLSVVVFLLAGCMPQINQQEIGNAISKGLEEALNEAAKEFADESEASSESPEPSGETQPSEEPGKVEINDGEGATGETSGAWPADKLPAGFPAWNGGGKIAGSIATATGDTKQVIITIEGATMDDFAQYGDLLKGSGHKQMLRVVSDEGVMYMLGEEEGTLITIIAGLEDGVVSGGITVQWK